MIGFDSFGLAVRTHLVSTWSAKCSEAGLYVPKILLEDPGENRPSEHYGVFGLLKASVAPYNGATDPDARLYRTLGRAQLLLHLKAGSGPAPADKYALAWRKVWAAFMVSGTRPAGVYTYSPSQANEVGSNGTHAIWALDVPFRFDEL